MITNARQIPVHTPITGATLTLDSGATLLQRKTVGEALISLRTEVFKLSIDDLAKKLRLTPAVLKSMESATPQNEALLKHVHLIFAEGDNSLAQYNKSQRALFLSTKENILTQLTSPWAGKSNGVMMRWCYMVGVEKFIATAKISRDQLLSLKNRNLGIPYEQMLKWGKALGIVPKFHAVQRYWSHPELTLLRNACVQDANVCHKSEAVTLFKILIFECNIPFTEKGLTDQLKQVAAPEEIKQVLTEEKLPKIFSSSKFFYRLPKHIPESEFKHLAKICEREIRSTTRLAESTWRSMLTSAMQEQGISEPLLGKALNLNADQRSQLRRVLEDRGYSLNLSVGLLSTLVARSSQELHTLLNTSREASRIEYRRKTGADLSPLQCECKLWGVTSTVVPELNPKKAFIDIVSTKLIPAIEGFLKQFQPQGVIEEIPATATLHERAMHLVRARHGISELFAKDRARLQTAELDLIVLPDDPEIAEKIVGPEINSSPAINITKSTLPAPTKPADLDPSSLDPSSLPKWIFNSGIPTVDSIDLMRLLYRAALPPISAEIIPVLMAIGSAGGRVGLVPNLSKIASAQVDAKRKISAKTLVKLFTYMQTEVIPQCSLSGKDQMNIRSICSLMLNKATCIDPPFEEWLTQVIDAHSLAVAKNEKLNTTRQTPLQGFDLVLRSTTDWVLYNLRQRQIKLLA